MPAKYDESFRDELEALTNKYSDTELVDILGLARANVHLLRKRLNVLSFSEKTGLKKNPKTGVAMRGSFEKVQFNRQFFKLINSETKAYFLGLMMTDGCVHGSMNCASLGLKRSDVSILERFCDALSLEKRHIKERDWILEGRPYPASELYLSSSELCEDLVKHGVLAGTAKTLNCFLATPLPRPLLRAFIRGVFDGDGSISVSWAKNKTIDSSRTRIFTASLFLFEQLASIFDAENIWYNTSKETKNRKTPIYCIDFGAVRSNDFLPWIYEDATIYLDRKYNKWIEVLSKTTRPW